jgi:RNA polymerase sigma-70 factor (ECF subfamily)
MGTEPPKDSMVGSANLPGVLIVRLARPEDCGESSSVSLHPFETRAVSTSEGRPQGAAEREATHGSASGAVTAGIVEAGQGRRSGRMLRGGGEGDVLRAVGQVGVLRTGGREDGEGLRLPLTVAEPGAEIGAAAWGEMHERIRAFVARRIPSGDVDDVVQKVFLKMHLGLVAMKQSDRLGPWLHQIARNTVVDHYRMPARRKEIASGLAEDFDRRTAEWDEADEEAGVAQAVQCLRPMVDRLPEPYRRAIQLVEMQGMSQVAAARVEGITVPGMKSRVQRGKQRLKNALLECCRFAIDARGGVMGCQTRSRGGCAS